MPNTKWLSLLVLAGCQTANPSSTAPAGSPRQSLPASKARHAGRAPGRTEPGVASDCVNYSVTTRGPFQYQNNMWAQDKAKGPFEQCVITRQIDGKAQLGWTWDWPGFEPLGFGYPEIIFGWKPWSDKSTTLELPIRIADLQELALRYAVSTESAGEVALSISVFVTDSADATRPNPRAIMDEIVVWLDYPDDATPVGTRTALVELAGVQYELWHTPDHGNRGDGTGWDLYYFKGPNQQVRGTTRLEQFFDALLKKNLLRADHFVASVELGDELMSGSGTTWVQDFQVVVQPRG
jgi:Glycosyl hydrolase family 12